MDISDLSRPSNRKFLATTAVATKAYAWRRVAELLRDRPALSGAEVLAYLEADHVDAEADHDAREASGKW